MLFAKKQKLTLSSSNLCELEIINAVHDFVWKGTLRILNLNVVSVKNVLFKEFKKPLLDVNVTGSIIIEDNKDFPRKRTFSMNFDIAKDSEKDSIEWRVYSYVRYRFSSGDVITLDFDKKTKVFYPAKEVGAAKLKHLRCNFSSPIFM